MTGTHRRGARARFTAAAAMLAVTTQTACIIPGPGPGPGDPTLDDPTQDVESIDGTFSLEIGGEPDLPASGTFSSTDDSGPIGFCSAIAAEQQNSILFNVGDYAFSFGVRWLDPGDYTFGRDDADAPVFGFFFKTDPDGSSNFSYGFPHDEASEATCALTVRELSAARVDFDLDCPDFLKYDLNSTIGDPIGAAPFSLSIACDL